MSQQALENMISLAQQDQVVCEKLQGAATPEAFVEIGTVYGYEFSASELIAMMKARLETLMSQQSEDHSFLEDLSDDEAEMVAGGRMSGYRVSVNSYYHQTGLLVDLPGRFAVCSAGVEALGREFYENAFATQKIGKLFQTLKQHSGSFQLMNDAEAWQLFESL